MYMDEYACACVQVYVYVYVYLCAYAYFYVYIGIHLYTNTKCFPGMSQYTSRGVTTGTKGGVLFMKRKDATVTRQDVVKSNMLTPDSSSFTNRLLEQVGCVQM